MGKAIVYFVLIVLHAQSVSSCSPLPNWVPATRDEQWMAAEYVVQGEVAEVQGDEMGCVTTEDGCWVHIKVVEVHKGKSGFSSACDPSTLESFYVTGFTQSAACGIDTPEVGAKGTFFLCSMEEKDGKCTAKLNTKGDIHIGFVRGEVKMPDGCTEAIGVCQEVKKATQCNVIPFKPDTTCGDVKMAYKEQKCCGNPSAKFTFGRRLMSGRKPNNELELLQTLSEEFTRARRLGEAHVKRLAAQINGVLTDF